MEKEPNLNNFDRNWVLDSLGHQKNTSNNSAFSLIILTTFLRLTYSEIWKWPHTNLGTVWTHLWCITEETFNLLGDSYGFKF